MLHIRLIQRRLVLSAWAWICCLAICVQAAEKNAAYRSALESITSADLTGYVDYLADVKMEGREAGTRGGRAAGDYLTNNLPSSSFALPETKTASNNLSRRIIAISWE